jgi:cytochrome c oxidase subunit 3
VAFHQVNDSVFGSSMYILTVFHGGHVFIGTLFLFVCLIRFLLGHFKTVSYLALTLAA